MHPRRVEPDQPGRVRLLRAVDEIERGVEELVVDGLHPLDRQWPGVLALLLAHRAEARVGLAAVGFGRVAAQHAARAELFAESGIFRVVRILRLLLGVEVIEVAEELVEAVHRRQVRVAIAQMVLAELAGGVAERLEQLGERRVFRLQPEVGARQADLEQAGPKARLAGDEGGAAGGAALLAIVVGEDQAFVGDAVDVGRLVAHHATVVVADVPVADVVAHDDQNVRSLLLLRRERQRPESEQHSRTHGGCLMRDAH